MSNYDDKKTRSPPGWEYLTNEEGFHGLYDSDVVRAALWRVEVWGPNREKDSGLCNFDNFGKKCKSCNKMGVSWKALLKLEDQEKPAKHMKHAWNGSCKSNSHKSHPLGPPQLTDPVPKSSSTASPASSTSDSCSVTPTREPIVQATTELVGHETRYPKNTPKNITRQGACNGPYCIVDTVYVLIEQKYGYNVDSSVRAGEHVYYPGDDWCVEQSAHGICEYPDEPEEKEDEDEDEDEEVGEDEDEYADFVQDSKTPDNKSAVDKTPGGKPQKEQEPTSEKDEATRKFEESLKLANWRWGCICGGNGPAGQHGIKCFDKGVTTKTTTVKGRMKQTHSWQVCIQYPDERF
jgi:hypothetical protein